MRRDNVRLRFAGPLADMPEDLKAVLRVAELKGRGELVAELQAEMSVGFHHMQTKAHAVRWPSRDVATRAQAHAEAFEQIARWLNEANARHVHELEMLSRHGVACVSGRSAPARVEADRVDVYLQRAMDAERKAGLGSEEFRQQMLDLAMQWRDLARVAADLPDRATL